LGAIRCRCQPKGWCQIRSKLTLQTPMDAPVSQLTRALKPASGRTCSVDVNTGDAHHVLGDLLMRADVKPLGPCSVQCTYHIVLQVAGGDRV
jgi:hypothetical protein